MAVAVASVSAVARASSNSTVTVTKPTGLAAGNLMVAFVSTFNNDSIGYTLNTPSGWTGGITDVVASDGANRGTVGAVYKIADSSDAAASNFSFTVNGGTADLIAGVMYRITGNSATVLNASNGDQAANTASPSIAAGITPSIADCLLLQHWASISGSSTTKSFSSYAIATSNPTWTEGYDDAGGTTLSVGGAYANRPETTATGNVSVSIAGGDGGQDNAMMILAIKPSVAVTVTPTVLSIATSIIAPTIKLGFRFAASVLAVGVNFIAPTIKLVTGWDNDAKSSTTWTNDNKS
jgi:hypothetical protein